MTDDFGNARVMIGIPTYNGWDETFGQCVIQALVHAQQCGVTITMKQSVGTLLNDVRTHLVEQAMAMGATHIMFFDNDMSFPPDTIMRLLAHKKPIVGANYTMRKWPYRPTSKTADHKRFLYTDHMSTGLEMGSAGGFGAVLIEMGVFEAISRPWFDGGEARNTVHPEKQTGFGEDYYLCYKARQELGEDFGFWVDHDLSKLVGHIGKVVFDFEDALKHRVEAAMVKDGDLEKPGVVLPHEKFEDIADLHEKHGADELAEVTKGYRERLAAEEAAQREAILAENERRMQEFIAA